MSYNIFDICVSDTDLTEGIIEEVIDIVESYSEDYHPWKAAHYMSWCAEDTFTYIDKYGNDNFTLDGGLQGQRIIVDAKTWVKTLKEHVGILDKDAEVNTKMKYNLYEIYFKTKEATQEQLEELFSLALQETCLSVDHLLYKPSSESDHVSFWAEGGYLDGLSEESHISGLLSNPQKVSPEVFVNVVREFYSEEEKKVENIKPTKWETEADFIEWGGGECPVERTVLVEYNMRGYDKTDVAEAGSLRWKHIDSSTDIVAYRVVSEATKPVTAVVDVHVTVPAVPHKVPVTIRKFTEEPRPRFRKRRQRPVKGKKPVVRIIYTDQSTYCFKNVKQVQVYDNKVYIAYQRQVEDGIVENSEAEIDGSLVMGVVIQKDLDNAQIFHNIDKTWDFFDEHGTAIRGAFNITKTIN